MSQNQRTMALVRNIKEELRVIHRLSSPKCLKESANSVFVVLGCTVRSMYVLMYAPPPTMPASDVRDAVELAFSRDGE